MLAAGVLLLLPGACTFVRSMPNRNDAGVAFTEVARIRLDSFRAGSPIGLVFRVPDTAQWRRLREAWGDHGYIAYAEQHEGSTRSIIPLSKLNLEVTVSRAGGRLVVERSRRCHSYLVSSEDCAVTFKPSARDELEITLLFRGSEKPPPGDFVIAPYWGDYPYDRVVGTEIESALRPYLVGMAAIGIVLLIASSILAINSARRARQT